MPNFSKHNERIFLKTTSQSVKNRALYEGAYQGAGDRSLF